MVFKGTNTIEWNVLGQPLGSMVFWWFCGQATIGFDGLRWLSTIGPTIEWLHTIVEVYSPNIVFQVVRYLPHRELPSWGSQAGKGYPNQIYSSNILLSPFLSLSWWWQQCEGAAQCRTSSLKTEPSARSGKTCTSLMSQWGGIRLDYHQMVVVIMRMMRRMMMNISGKNCLQRPDRKSATPLERY